MRFRLRFSHRPNPELTKMLAPMTSTFSSPRISPVVLLVSSRGERVCLQLRASSDHRFIVGAPRARETARLPRSPIPRSEAIDARHRTRP